MRTTADNDVQLDKCKSKIYWAYSVQAVWCLYSDKVSDRNDYESKFWCPKVVICTHLMVSFRADNQKADDKTLGLKFVIKSWNIIVGE